MTELNIDGHIFKGYVIPTPHVSMLVITSARGMLCCGYISMGAAEKFHDAAAMVSGVKNFDDMLNAAVVMVTSEAESMGVKPGMTGKEALLAMV